jgi:hypothetical protein
MAKYNDSRLHSFVEGFFVLVFFLIGFGGLAAIAQQEEKHKIESIAAEQAQAKEAQMLNDFKEMQKKIAQLKNGNK